MVYLRARKKSLLPFRWGTLVLTLHAGGTWLGPGGKTPIYWSKLRAKIPDLSRFRRNFVGQPLPQKTNGLTKSDTGRWPQLRQLRLTDGFFLHSYANRFPLTHLHQVLPLKMFSSPR